MPEAISSQPSFAVRRWTRSLAELRQRVKRQRDKRDARPDSADEGSTEDALALCELLLQETAAAELAMRRIAAQERRTREVQTHLFDKMPIACVVTDAAGYIQSANRAAALLLSVSASALEGRLFLLFVEDRTGLQDLLHLQDGGTHYATLTIRPRELRPLKVQVTLAPDTPNEATGWVWYLQPHERFLNPRPSSVTRGT
jgi:PAS domain-containing protein